MQPSNITSINWGNTSTFTGYIYDGVIYTFTGEQLGVSLAKYQEVEQGLIKCKNRLIELGEIKVPKTPEQIIQEQQDMIAKQNEMMNSLMEKINELRTNYELPSSKHEEQCETSITESITDNRSNKHKNKRRCDQSTQQSDE